MRTLDLNPEAENERLQLFNFSLPDEQEAFIDAATAEGYVFDYSLTSLADLERYVRAKALTVSDASDEAVAQRVNCWAYLGQVVRHNFGGRWAISMNEDNSLNRGLFVVEGHAKTPGVEFVPNRLLQAFIQRGRGGEWRRAIEAQTNPQPIDLSDLVEKEQ